MELNYLDESTYGTLLGILSESFPSLVEGFASLFEIYQKDEEKFYCIPDVNAYTIWLSNNIFEGEPLGDDEIAVWLNWTGTVLIKSTQGGGSIPG